MKILFDIRRHPLEAAALLMFVMLAILFSWPYPDAKFATMAGFFAGYFSCRINGQPQRS